MSRVEPSGSSHDVEEQESSSPRGPGPYWAATRAPCQALLAVSVATASRWVLDPLFGNTLPFPTYFLAVILVSWLGGMRAGLLAAVMGLPLSWYFFVPPRHTFVDTPGPQLVGLLVYLFVSLAIVFSGESLRRSRHAEQRNLREVKGWPTARELRLHRGTGEKSVLDDTAMVGFLLTLAALVVGAVLGRANTLRLIENDLFLSSAHTRAAELESLLSTLKDAETGQRGYLLTDDASYLEPYLNATERIWSDVARLHAAAADEPEQQARFLALEQKIAKKLEELEKTITLARNGNRPAAFQDVRENTGKELMDGMRGDVLALQEVEREVLRKRTADSEATARLTIRSNMIVSSIGIALLLGVFYLSRRNLRMRQSALDATFEQQERLRVTLASIGDAVIATDVDGRVTFLNAVAELLTGWKPEDARGQPLESVFRIVNEKSLEPAENPAKKALREGRVVGLANHTALVQRDGSRIAIDDSAAPIRDSGGQIVGVVLVFHDIEERRQAEAALAASVQRFRLAAEAVNGIICEHDLATGGVERTMGLFEVLGYLPDEAPPTAAWWRDQIHPDDRDGYLKSFKEAAESGSNMCCTYRFRHKDGRWLQLEDRAVTLRSTDEKPIKLVACALDVTQRKQAEDALRESETRTRRILEYQEAVMANMGEGLYAVDLQGRVTYFNPTAEKLLGWTRSEILGAEIHDVTHFKRPDGTPFPIEECSEFKVLQSGSSLKDFDDVFIRKDGGFLTVTYSATPLRSEGRIVGLVVVFRDTTERRLAEESLRYQTDLIRNITENATTAIFMTDHEGRTTFMNPAAEAMTGFTLQEGQGRLLRDLVHSVSSSEAVPGAPDGPWPECSVMRDHEDVFVRKGGERFPVLLNACPIHKHGLPVATVLEVRDITQEKLNEKRVYGLLTELQDTDRRKNEFLATLAHELRNPLAPLRHSLEIMKRANGNLSTLEQVSATMERQVSHMVRLVDDLLDVNRITRNKLELKKKPVELGSILEHAIEVCRPLAESQGQELHVVLPARPNYLHADDVRLVQVFSNLLTNAFKYTERGGRIWLSVEQGELEVIVSVKDSGIGIQPDKLPQVFDLFTQIDKSLEMSQGGLGIGLALVKRLVQMHEGSVTAHSAGPGRGSEFRVRLPVLSEEPALPKAPAEIPVEAPSARARILVVDDNVDAALSLTLLLRMGGNEVHMAHDAAEAIAKGADHYPHLILLDIGLPKVNGYEVCQRIRQQPWGKETRIVALTGWGQEEDRRKSKESGFDAHLIKPVDHATLVKLLAELAPGDG